MKIEDLIEELLDNGIQITINKFEGEKRYHLPGFYKSNGFVYLVQEGEKVIAYQRYGEKKEIWDLADLLYLNKYWWEITKERNPGSTMYPDDEWKKLLLDRGIIKAETKTITTYS
jgi:hypothetical protein